MMTKKIATAALSALTVLMTSSAFADQAEEFRPGRGHPGRWRCARAEANLRNAEQAFQAAAIQLQNSGRICGGAPACIYAAQVHYNNTLTNLQVAQNEYNRACF